MEIRENTYRNNLYTSEQDILRKIKQSKRSIQDIKVGLASFNAEDSEQDSYLLELQKERNKYNKLLRDLGVVKGRNKQINSKRELNIQLKELREEKRGTSPSGNDDILKSKFQYDSFSYNFRSYKKSSFEQKQIIDSIIY